MVNFYSGKKTKNLFDPAATEPFKLSRSKLELFLKCPHCFYLDRRLGVPQPAGFPFNLNSAVDHLLKKEFDIHRAKGEPHPLMKTYGIDAVPYNHPNMNNWREINFGNGGIHFIHPETNFDVYGAVDDIWVNPAGELIVVDYKATAKDSEVNIDADWQKAYKNQLEIYQWLLRQNGFKVSDTGYFVYLNGRRDATTFDGKLEFDVTIIPYRGNNGWIEPALIDARNCLLADQIPPVAKSCEYCAYRQLASEAESTSN